MKKTLIDILSSKKAITALLAFAAAIAAKFGFDLDTDSIELIVAPLIAYILAQGVADHGKEAAKEQAKGAPATIPATASGE